MIIDYVIQCIQVQFFRIVTFGLLQFFSVFKLVNFTRKMPNNMTKTLFKLFLLIYKAGYDSSVLLWFFKQFSANFACVNFLALSLVKNSYSRFLTAFKPIFGLLDLYKQHNSAFFDKNQCNGFGNSIGLST